MATPIKLLLSPKLLSPLSPLSPIRSKVRSLLGVASSQNKSLGVVAKKLVFRTPSKRTGEEIRNKTNIKIRVTGVGDKEILEIDTPNKTGILEKGLGTFDLSVLGKGAFGTVIKSTYKETGKYQKTANALIWYRNIESRIIAAKVVKLRENKRDPNESLALDLRHPNVIEIREVITDAKHDHGIIVMEYLASFANLQSVISRTETDLGDATIREYCGCICSAMSYCHEKKLAHLDIKPTNVLVNEVIGVCKLCDFGNCVRLDEEESEDDAYAFSGTVTYAAPELLLGRRPTAKCDIYSFGVLLWQLIHRENPYGDIKQYELVVYQVVKFNLRPKCSVKNEAFDRLYKECWSQEPGARPNAEEVLHYLRERSN